jgi:glycosyltransferase involved in cell wall biosynthesis
MNFTFGIITSGNNAKNIHAIIDSIEMQKIPYYEVIVVGDDSIQRKHTRSFPFDESVKKAWITRKKNIITYYAHHENIVFLHDYIVFEPGWYEGYLKIGNDFPIASNVMLDATGARWIDWSLWFEDVKHLPGAEAERLFMLPYEVRDLTRFMYLAGSYWVAKRHVMQEFPLDEQLIWGEGEDVLWSKQVRQKYPFVLADQAVVKFLKPKGNPFNFATPEMIQQLRQQLR